MSPFMYALAGSVLLSTALGYGLYKTVQHNGELAHEIETANLERDHAKAEKAALTEATRKHAQELARSRKQAAAGVATLSRSSDDGCIDRAHAADLGDMLRMQPATDPAKPAPASRRKADAPVRR